MQKLAVGNATRIIIGLLSGIFSLLAFHSMAAEYVCSSSELFEALSGPTRQIRNLSEEGKSPTISVDFTRDKEVSSYKVLVLAGEEMGSFVQRLDFDLITDEPITVTDEIGLRFANLANQDIAVGSVSFDKSGTDESPVFVVRHTFPWRSEKCEIEGIRTHFDRFDRDAGYVLRRMKAYVEAVTDTPKPQDDHTLEPTDRETAIRELTESAEQGDPESQYVLGVLYKRGRGVEVNEKVSLAWFLKAAKQGYVDAQTRLALMYSSGRGTPVDQESAFYWYKLAAEGGNAIAQNNLALMYSAGEAVDKDPEAAFRWINAAIESGLEGGNPETTLGYWYLAGKHAPIIPVDYEKGLYWNRRGAEAGHTNAHSNLALMYFVGIGVEQNFQAMLQHLIKSVELFTSEFDWIFDDDDEWLAYKDRAPDFYWKARELYWKAIKTGDEEYLSQLKQLLNLRALSKPLIGVSADCFDASGCPRQFGVTHAI